MYKKPYLLLLNFILLLFFYCNKLTDPYILHNFEGITETDDQGNLIGFIDTDDWSQDAYNIYFGKSIWIYDYSSVMMFNCNIVGNEIIKTLSIKNISKMVVRISTNTHSPFSCQPEEFELLPETIQTLDVKFRLPFYTEQPFYDTLTIICNENESAVISLTGYTDSTDIFIIAIPAKTKFYPAYPNPTTTSTNLNFSLQYKSNVILKIIDKNEKIIKELINGERNPGLYSVLWELDNSSGNKVKSGIYRAILEADNFNCHGDIQVK